MPYGYSQKMMQCYTCMALLRVTLGAVFLGVWARGVMYQTESPLPVLMVLVLTGGILLLNKH